ncbi:hypothetical protein D3C83_146470 [compost metagenome]
MPLVLTDVEVTVTLPTLSEEIPSLKAPAVVTAPLVMTTGPPSPADASMPFELAPAVLIVAL